jgi:hypothetical protein
MSKTDKELKNLKCPHCKAEVIHVSEMRVLKFLDSEIADAMALYDCGYENLVHSEAPISPCMAKYIGNPNAFFPWTDMATANIH